ncbi:hypothetical protein LWI28_009035 [Acer negundo]|uniref:Glucose-1-phosphate adenylyltransferase/Bifunctional protein GlmU-like C-terminal hexapeptide domain-containing protein n=1 Tax=Acer negundo TaxID=4023 RepID=A0AAD5JQI9_ACENE|nr:hypothetical protein LWI28_009035 [Acer negundo]
MPPLSSVLARICGTTFLRITSTKLEAFSYINYLMAVNLKRFSVFYSKKKYIQLDFLRLYYISTISGVENHQDFQKWHNGGGTFHQSACIDPTVLIEVGAIVHSKALLGANVCIGSGAVVGPSVTIGQSTKIGYNVALSNCIVGDSCAIHNGVCIGQDGFGFFVDEHGNMVKKPQMLIARIGNHVEIGANSCIDRGSWRDTVIGDHSKIDNLVQIGHNVIIGKNCMFCGQTGIAGSVTIGDYVTLGGRVAVRDHVSIASKVRLAANSCVTKDITEPGDYGGFPAVPIREWRRQVANQFRISKKGTP